MPLYGQPGGTPVGQFDNLVGAPVTVNLTTIAAGGSQGAALLPSDYVFVGTADSTNLACTLPNPYLYGGSTGDRFTVVNAGSGQTVKIFPPTGGNIDGAGSNTQITIATNKSVIIYLVSFTSTTSVWNSSTHS